MKTLEEMTKDELYQLCITLLRDMAEVQGRPVDDYAKDFYDVKW